MIICKKKSLTPVLLILIISFAINTNFFINLTEVLLFGDTEIEFSARTTMERIIFTTSGFYVFLVLNFIKNLNKNFLKKTYN
jgi:hypothetical protein